MRVMREVVKVFMVFYSMGNLMEFEARVENPMDGMVFSCSGVFYCSIWGWLLVVGGQFSALHKNSKGAIDFPLKFCWSCMRAIEG